MKRADELKIIAMCYWRFNRGCPIVAIEYSYRDSDVIAVQKDGDVIDTEVKVTLQDLKRDRQKTKHLVMGREMDFIRGKPAEFPYMRMNFSAHYFYFAVPTELEARALPVVQAIYPYAGLMVINPDEHSSWNYNRQIDPAARIVKEPHRFPKLALTEKKMLDIARGMSTTACKVAYELMMKEREK